ncbi:MAG: hypothetical protein Q9182_007517 [Xanthomendoza sp. 2 TL-2023]
MAASRSLQDEASAVSPLVPTDSKIILVAVWYPEESRNDPQVDEFVFFKCRAKTSLAKIHKAYGKWRKEKEATETIEATEAADATETTVPWILKHKDNPINLESTVGDINEPGGILIVFEAVNTAPRTQDPALRILPSRTTPAGGDNRHYLYQYDLSTLNHSPSAPVVLTHPLSPPSSHAPQRSSAPPALSTPNMELGLGNFSVYRNVAIAQWRTLSRGESEDYLNQRLWNNWQSMGNLERARYSFSQQPGYVMAEEVASAPIPPRQVSTVGGTKTPLALLTTKDESGLKPFQLLSMLKHASLPQLETTIESTVKLLNTLREPLADKIAHRPDAEKWIQQIDNLKELAMKRTTVIVVVGNMGAGKSSVINAILEFITIEDWAKELKILFQVLLDGKGKISRDYSNEDSEAGVAYAKIKAVYPNKTKDDISCASTDGMLQELSHILGTHRNIEATDSCKFQKSLQSYIDSQEMSTEDKDSTKQKHERELWPLIRVVRLYVKSPTLATGAVIVDLPGVYVANAVRSVVADGYIKQCTGLWIVVPINRAVNDKAAKSFLGESFMKQLKMRSCFNVVTIICSMTDDISISEAQDLLGLDDKRVPLRDELDHLSTKKRDLEKKLRELSDTKAIHGDAADDIAEQIEVWRSLEGPISKGKIAFSPETKAIKKRKPSSKVSSKQKKRRVFSSDAEYADFIDDHSDEDDALDSNEEVTSNNFHDQQPLTEEEDAAKLKELEATKKNARVQKQDIMEKIHELRNKLREVENAEAEINQEMFACWISGRSQYFKGVIRQDFAAGIKEIDQKIAAVKDQDHSDPDIDVRDYDELAKDLPVFCVSSRAYHELQRRLRNGRLVPGSRKIEETEIPALQAHCEKLTKIGRAANCRAFIDRLNSLLNP